MITKKLPSWISGGILGLAGIGSVHAAPETSTETQSIQFNRDIRPIFSENCYACHGPDKNKRKADLRFDLKEEALKQLDSDEFAIFPGDPSKSRLLELVSTADEDDRMPPVKTGKQLTEAQISLLRTWIEQGAPWQQHWSYMPLVRPPQPSVEDTSWPLNPVDYFVLARLEAEKLHPSREANKQTSLRRLSFDLTGLPPSPENFRKFTSNSSERGYERLVDRLLSSPQYGERMASHWLDLVRYADTDGFHADNYRSVYPYRDYVIRAFNNNMPFDQFTIEQMGGDLLPSATLSQEVASTYNRLNRTTEEGGSQAKEYLAKYAADRVRTTSAVWLGATMGCAECHDHKFDPFTTKDFYNLAAFFADVKERGVGKPEGTIIPTPIQKAEIDRLEKKIASLDVELGATTNRMAITQAKWEETLLTTLEAGELEWVPLKPIHYTSQKGSTLSLTKDLSLIASGKNPDNEVYTTTVATDRELITGIRLEITQPSPKSDDDSASSPESFVLTEFTIEVMSGRSIVWEQVSIGSANASSELRRSAVTAAIDSKQSSGWTANAKDSRHSASFVFSEPVSGGAGTVFKIHLKHGTKSQKPQNIRRFRLSLSTVPNPNHSDSGIAPETLSALKTPKAERSEKQSAAVVTYYLDTTPEVTRLRTALTATKKEKQNYVNTVPTTLATVAINPRVMRVLPRGNWMDDSGEVVQPAVPEFLSGSAVAASENRLTRLDLARWLVSDDNPTTARAFVNRLWKIYFGTGLSKIMDDLGSQGEWPTHPELLDWLAVEFRDSGWDVKHIVKLIVSSRTYRQTSFAPPEVVERDPYNQFMARQGRFRLEAEMLRDNALAVSGLLATEVGGPSVKPYQPAGYWQHLNFPKRKYQKDQGANIYRRGLYTFWCRTFLHPSLMAFDAPSREECTVNRDISNNPLQALVLLNDPTYVEAARVFAEHIVQNSDKSVEEGLKWTFQTALTRTPTQSEIKELSNLYAKQLERYSDDKEAAAKLIGLGENDPPDHLNTSELAAWTSIARVIFNLHEFITRY